MMGCRTDKSSGLCPVSFGLALGITCALCILLFYIWIMYYGMPENMDRYHGMIEDPITWLTAFVHAGWCLLKGFIFGFVFALIYNVIACCGKKWCHGKCEKCGSANCNCGNNCAKCGSTNCNCR